MIITTDLVDAFLKCPTKCFLRSCEEVGTGNAYADWVRIRRDFFRSEGIKRLAAELAPDKYATSTLVFTRCRQEPLFANLLPTRGGGRE
jgi:hypothetical protein